MDRRRGKGSDGHYVVEVTLLNGDREIVTQRNGVHRFSHADATKFSEQLNQTFEKARAAGDPYCYSDDSKTFGLKTRNLELLGMKETQRPVDRARARRYDERVAARYSRPGQWYAPLLYLRDAASGEAVTFRDAVFMLTNPLELESFLENWHEAGIDVGDYRTESLLDDDAFDAFMRWNEARGCFTIVDPVLDSANADLISGKPIVSLERLQQSRED